MKLLKKTSSVLSLVALCLCLSACSHKIDDVIVIDLDDEQASTVDSKTSEPTEAPKDSKSDAQATEKDGYAVAEERDLFNGKDLTGWTNESGGAPVGWTVEDGLLRLTDPAQGKDLLTKDSFADYILEFEWRFGRACNSGVKYKIEQPNDRGWVGLEYQIQDDANVEDGKVDDRKIASLFDVLAARASTKNDEYPAPTTDEPDGNFRRGKIVVVGKRVEHWIDDEKVLEFEIGSDAWNEGKAQSKFKNQKNFGLVDSSPILLQAHGFPVDFKSVKIKILAR